jgi:hypothetical protein
MDLIQLRPRDKANPDDFGSTLTFESNFGLDVPRVGEHLMLPGGVSAVVTKVVRRFRPASQGVHLVQYDRHVYVDEEV